MVAVHNSQGPAGAAASSVDRLVSDCVHTLCAELTANDDGFAQLNTVLKHHRFQTLFDLYQIVSRHYSAKLKPYRENAARIVQEVELEVNGVGTSRGSTNVEATAIELLERLSSPNFHALIEAHDTVAAHSFELSLMDIPYEVDEDDGAAVRIVRLMKKNEPLGATIKRLEKNSALVIARVIRGGIADRSGCIGVGDQVIEVNGISVVGKEPIEVVKLINSGDSSVTLKLVPVDRASVAAIPAVAKSPDDPSCSTMLHLRAMFDYSPQEDSLNPCPEASLQFRCGHVLQVVDANDDKWWQARLETGSDTSKVGLIPSWQLQNRKQLSKRSPVHGSSPLPRSISSLRKHRCSKMQ
ncbi:unnamed protein product [Soboliphyme baturini]|uniref:MAGUK p55 subfamily member 7-like n=1 Tax=Soboliphyme baturini TaxID=241478 RepID=A0A183IYH2_9BILA|nr:unnamed protein product [Soboliphyme baturini]